MYTLFKARDLKQVAFVRSANIFKTDKIIDFDKILLNFRAFIVNRGPQMLFSNILLASEHFFFGMWPSYTFEFKTPGLRSVFACLTS